MQTILGAGGAISTELAKELTKYTDSIRLVGRNPKKVNPTDELYKLDVTQFHLIEKAIAGSTVVYVTIGFEYKLKTWQTLWPAFMDAVIKACLKHKAKLVFFDNVYMYDISQIPNMTEESSMHSPSKKGKVRFALHKMIMDNVSQNGLSALIARSADFYGPGADKSAITETVIKNLLKGKAAQGLVNIKKIHTYTYTPDAAKATALLGNTEDAYNQVWHLPTTKEKLTNEQWIQLFQKEIGVTSKISVIPKWLLSVIGWFVPVMKELPEMMYQNELDYVFDSTKFENRFHSIATEPAVGVKKTVDYYRNQLKK